MGFWLPIRNPDPIIQDAVANQLGRHVRGDFVEVSWNRPILSRLVAYQTDGIRHERYRYTVGYGGWLIWVDYEEPPKRVRPGPANPLAKLKERERCLAS